MDIGSERQQEFLDSGLVEDSDVGYRLERGYDLCALAYRQHWSAVAFLKGNLPIGVDANDQYVTQFSGACEIADMADVKNVEAPVREHDSRAVFSGGSDPLRQLFATQNPIHRLLFRT
jgi:hypothetical protein